MPLSSVSGRSRMVYASVMSTCGRRRPAREGPAGPPAYRRAHSPSRSAAAAGALIGRPLRCSRPRASLTRMLALEIKGRSAGRTDGLSRFSSTVPSRCRSCSRATKIRRASGEHNERRQHSGAEGLCRCYRSIVVRIVQLVKVPGENRATSESHSIYPLVKQRLRQRGIFPESGCSQQHKE